MFKILILYKDEIALEKYLKRFYDIPEKPLKKLRHERIYANDYMTILCIRGLHENVKGHKAHFVAVQEDLTWIDKWHEIRRCVLAPMIISPIPLQVFDGNCPEDRT